MIRIVVLPAAARILCRWFLKCWLVSAHRQLHTLCRTIIPFLNILTWPLLVLCTTTSSNITSPFVKLSRNQNRCVTAPQSLFCFGLSLSGRMSTNICSVVFMYIPRTANLEQNDSTSKNKQIKQTKQKTQATNISLSVQRQWLIVKLCSKNVRSYMD